MKFQWVEHLSLFVDGRPKGQPRGRAFALKRCPSGHMFQPQKPVCPRCGQPGKVTARVHDQGTAEAWKGDVARALRPHLPDRPLDEPLKIDIDFYFPRPQTFSKRVRMAYRGKSKFIPRGPVLFPSKPDRDNADKAVLDALEALGFMRGDQLAVDGHIRKFYAGEGGRIGARVRIWLWRPCLEIG